MALFDQLLIYILGKKPFYKVSRGGLFLHDNYSSVIWTFFLWYHRMILSVSTNNWLWYWKVSGMCDVKHIMTLLIKTITSIFKVSSYIITSIASRHIGLAAIIVMSVSTFKSTVILYLRKTLFNTVWTWITVTKLYLSLIF